MKTFGRRLKPELFKNKITAKTIKSDIIAGVTVGVIAIPLSLVFAIRSGAAPAVGLMTAIVAGVIAASFGGSKYQITGPTAAFVALSLSIIGKFGYSGLSLSIFIAGIILIIGGILRLGGLIKFVTPSIVSGFTAGIAVTLFIGQLPDFFGLDIANFPPHFIGRVKAIFAAPKINLPDFIVAAVSFCCLIFLPKKITKFLPASIAAIFAGLAVDFAFSMNVHTIGSKYGDIHLSLKLAIPYEGMGGQIIKLFPSAFTIAFLSAVVSLLSARVADSLSGEKHNPDAELIAQGGANLACGLFGLIPAAGAVARTGVNYETGAKTPLSAIFQAVLILLISIIFMPLLKVIPLASLAAVLIGACKNMINLKQLKSFLKISPFESAAFFITLIFAFLISLPLSMLVGLAFYYSKYLLMFLRRGRQGLKLAISVEGKNLTLGGYFGYLNIHLVQSQLDNSQIENIDLENISGFDYFGGKFLANKVAEGKITIKSAPNLSKTLAKYKV